MHGPELEQRKGLALETIAGLDEKDRPGGLNTLANPREQEKRRQNEDDHRQTDGDVEATLQESVDGVFEGLLAQAQEEQALVLEHGYGVAKYSVQVGHDQEPAAPFLTHTCVVFHGAVGAGQLHQDHIHLTGGAVELFQVPRPTENRKRLVSAPTALWAQEAIRRRALLPLVAWERGPERRGHRGSLGLQLVAVD